MVQTSFQFHAECSELVHSLLPVWLARSDYCVAVFKTSEAGSRLIETGGMELLKKSGVSQLLFRSDPFDVSRRDNYLDFLRGNTGFLSVRPARVRDGSLRESLMAAVAADAHALAPWRAVIRRARRDLLKGALVIGPTGIKVEEPHDRYSPGALELANSGVAMLAVAGGIRFELGAG